MIITSHTHTHANDIISPSSFAFITIETKATTNKFAKPKNKSFQDPQVFNQIMSSPVTPVVIQSPTVVTSSTPAFLSRFPRSLSALSMGGKKKPSDKETATPSPSNGGQLLQPPSSHHHHQHHHQHVGGHVGKMWCIAGMELSLVSSQQIDNSILSAVITEYSVPAVHSQRGKSTGILVDQPPPLPQRNFTRRSQPSPTAIQLDGIDGEVALRRNTQISDLDHSMTNLSSNDNTINNNNGASNATADTSSINISICSSSANNNNNSNNNNNASPSSASKPNKKRGCKSKIKANSDPKISSQMLIQMEKDYDKQQIVVATGRSIGSEPPPLPPRQPGMLEEIHHQRTSSGSNVTGNSCNRNESSASNSSRPSPNSLDTLLNYPLISTCTAVRDNMTSAFPLSHRPNIVQQLQQSSHSNNTTSNIHQHHSTTSSTCNKSTVSNSYLRTVNQIHIYTHPTHPYTHPHTHTLTHAPLILIRARETDTIFDTNFQIPSSSIPPHNSSQLEHMSR